MGKILYVGIDVSKKTLDIAITVDGDEIRAIKSVSNNKRGYDQLEQWIKAQVQRNGCEQIHYCLESTGVYSDWVAEYLYRMENSKVSVINPFQAKSFGKSMGIRTKTDKVDAELLALYGARQKPQETVQITKELRELRTLVRHLDYLINRRGQEVGRLESATNPMVSNSIKKIISSYEVEIQEIEKAIEGHINKHPGLKEKIKLLESIISIGEKTSKILLCEMHRESGDARISAKAQTAHAGLAPQEKSSGISVRGEVHICRTGNRRLRKCLYLPTVSAIRYNPVIKEFYIRLIEKGKPKKVALVAAMRKLLVIAVGVLNNGTPFDANWNRQKKYA